MLPTFLFALSQSTENPFTIKSLLIFIALEVFFQSGCNSFNDYCDKDTESIAGLENPPPVTEQVYYMSIFLQLAALATAWTVNLPFFVFILVLIFVSFAYSHPWIWLKSDPAMSWFINGFFYGYFSTMGIHFGLTGVEIMFLPRIQYSAILTSIVVFGAYPLSQVYQHDADRKRGLVTISMLLGISGTFWVAFISFTGLAIGYYNFFLIYYPRSPYTPITLFVVCMGPLGAYILNLFAKVLLGKLKHIEFKYIAKALLLQNIGCNLYYFWLALYTHYYY